MKRTRRNAFTLAEMLVVIAIILILASLLVPAVYLGLVAAKNAAIAVEVGQLDAAMKQYKVLYKNYPPSSDPAATGAEAGITAHIRSIFGRATSPTVPPPYGMTAAEALVFWLQGYSGNPIDPLSGTRIALMQFDQTRLKPTRVAPGSAGIQLYTYGPSEGQGQPYVYIHNGAYGSLTYTAVTPGKGMARAYKSSVAPNPYINAESFQIISAGLDGDYGTDNANKQFPAGVNYQTGDKDNVTNFSGGTLGSKVQ